MLLAQLAGALFAALLAAGSAALKAELIEYEVTGDEVRRPLGGFTGDAGRGRQIVVDRARGNCLICHAVPSIDAPFQGVVGPSLGGVAGRLNDGQIRLRMIDQSRINPATLMPPYYRIRNLHNVAPEYQGKPALDAQEIEDIVAFLMKLKE